MSKVPSPQFTRIVLTWELLDMVKFKVICVPVSAIDGVTLDIETVGGKSGVQIFVSVMTRDANPLAVPPSGSMKVPLNVEPRKIPEDWSQASPFETCSKGLERVVFRKLTVLSTPRIMRDDVSFSVGE